MILLDVVAYTPDFYSDIASGVSDNMLIYILLLLLQIAILVSAFVIIYKKKKKRDAEREDSINQSGADESREENL